MTCYRHRFHNQFEASNWGPPYQCPRCGWWHIRFIDTSRWPWPPGKIIFWVLLSLAMGYFWWIVFNAFISWNWPS